MKCSEVSIFFLILFFGLSCQRSPQYHKDENYGRNDSVSGNSNLKGSQSLTQKIESMGQPKKRVVVLDFWNDTPIRQTSLGAYAADELKRGLYLTQRVLVPTDAKNNLGTEEFIQGDNVKVAQLIREGRRMGVAILVIGRITKIVFRQRGDEIGVFRQKQSLVAVDIEAKLFDVQGGREIMATSRSGEANSNVVVAFESHQVESPSYRAELTKYAVREAMAGFIPDVIRSIEKMTWQGRVVKLTGPKVYLNAGRASGLIAGDILRVLAPGEDIYDPASGAYLGRSQGQLKGTLEVTDFIGTDGAVTETHTGGNFREGDLVQLY
jgi:hypothetical protein